MKFWLSRAWAARAQGRGYGADGSGSFVMREDYVAFRVK